MHKDLLGELIGWGIWLTGLAVSLMTLTGCSGIEMGGKLGVYRVDERQDSSKTYRQAVPLKCYFTACNDQPEDK